MGVSGNLCRTQMPPMCPSSKWCMWSADQHGHCKTVQSVKGQNLNLVYQYLTKLQMFFGYLRRCGVFPSRLQHDQHRNQSLLNSPIKKTQKLTKITMNHLSNNYFLRRWLCGKSTCAFSWQERLHLYVISRRWSTGRSQSFASCREVANHPTNVNGVPNSWKPNALTVSSCLRPFLPVARSSMIHFVEP